ncbi:MAG: hypothetical protein ACE5H8_07420 [Alphaproteobacteria bacterium]
MTLRRVRRVWAVAAIHGDAERLTRLHAVLAGRFKPGDRLVYLGNYMGYGADVCGTVDGLLAFRRALLARPGVAACDIVFLRGAQEEMWSKLLQIHLAFNPVEVVQWMLDRGVGATLAAYGIDIARGLARARVGAVDLARWTGELRRAMQARPGHFTLMSALRRAAFTDDSALLFVHAGVDASRPLAAQGDALWWGGGGFDSLAEPFGDFRLVVRGFDRNGGGFRVARFTATIDAGCGFGGPLCAGCFDVEEGLVDRIEA